MAQKCILMQTSRTNIILVFNITTPMSNIYHLRKRRWFCRYHCSRYGAIYLTNTSFESKNWSIALKSFRLSAARNTAKPPWQLFGLFLRYSSILFIGATLLQNDCLFTRYLSNFALRFRHSFMNYNHWGIIRPSKSPMASPIICVLKGKDEKGGMCLAIDYRYINKFTISDAYPTSDFLLTTFKRWEMPNT